MNQPTLSTENTKIMDGCLSILRYKYPHNFSCIIPEFRKNCVDTYIYDGVSGRPEFVEGLVAYGSTSSPRTVLLLSRFKLLAVPLNRVIC